MAEDDQGHPNTTRALSQRRYISAVKCFPLPWPLTIDTGLAQVTFITQPQNTTVMKGGDATFQCVGEENGMELLFGWDFIHQGGMLTTVITGTPVTGVSMVTVSGDRTQLTLSGV